MSKIQAVGAWFYCVNTRRYLFLMRSDFKFRGKWSLPGGKIEMDETLLDSLKRECYEEMGFWPDCNQIIPLERFTSENKRFIYNTFFIPVEEEFVPKLNSEHIGWAWVASGSWPKPLHPGLWSTMSFREIQSKIKSLENISL